MSSIFGPHHGEEALVAEATDKTQPEPTIESTIFYTKLPIELRLMVYETMLSLPPVFNFRSSDLLCEMDDFQQALCNLETAIAPLAATFGNECLGPMRIGLRKLRRAEVDCNARILENEYHEYAAYVRGLPKMLARVANHMQAKVTYMSREAESDDICYLC